MAADVERARIEAGVEDPSNCEGMICLVEREDALTAVAGLVARRENCLTLNVVAVRGRDGVARRAGSVGMDLEIA